MCKYFLLLFFSEINIFKTDTLPCPESEIDKDIARQRRDRQTGRQTDRQTDRARYRDSQKKERRTERPRQTDNIITTNGKTDKQKKTHTERFTTSRSSRWRCQRLLIFINRKFETREYVRDSGNEEDKASVEFPTHDTGSNNPGE